MYFSIIYIFIKIRTNLNES